MFEICSSPFLHALETIGTIVLHWNRADLIIHDRESPE